MNHEETFGQRLLKLLKRSKLSQLKLAQALGISRTAVNKWTKGGMIDDSNLEKLAAFLAVDKIWLKYGEYQSAEQVEGHAFVTRNINEIHLHESTEIVTWEWDILSDDLQYSDNVEQVYGIKLNSNQDFWALLSEGARAKLSAEYAKLIQNGGAHEMDFKINLDGESRWITSRATGVQGPNGKITKLIGISLDNTIRKKNEIQLRKFKHYFDLLLQNHPSLIAFIDQEGEVLASNCLDKQTDFFHLQRLLYQLVLEQKSWISQICHQGQGDIVFQDKKISAVHGLNEEGQVFLMLEIQ